MRIASICAVLVALVACLLFLSRTDAGEAPRPRADRAAQPLDPGEPGDPALVLADARGERAPVDGRAAAPSPKEADSTLVVRVVNADGRPVVGAAVHSVEVDAGLERLGSTDGSGRLAVSPARDRGFVAATFGNLTHESAGFDLARDSEVTLVLRPAGRIPGRVVFENGDPVGPGVRIVALPDSRIFPDPEWVRRLRGGHATDPVATTGADGRFELTGLDREAVFQLYAAGSGLASRNGPTQARPEGVEVELVVSALYGVTVRLIDGETGALVDVAPEFSSNRKGVLLLNDPSVRIFAGDRSLASLALASEPVVESSSSSYTYFFTVSGGAPRVGPLKYTVELPGYHPGEFDVYAHPVDGGVVDEVFGLTPQTPERGSLTVLLEGWCTEAVRADALFGPEVTVMLTSTDGSRFRFAVPTRPGGRIVLTGIPRGRYTARVQSAHGGSTFRAESTPGTTVEVPAADGDATLRIDVSGAGALELRPVLVNGARYHGPLEVRLLRDFDEGQIVHEASFHRGPYVFRGLSAGNWSYVLLGNRGAAPDESAVGIERGRVTSVEPRLR